MNDTVIENLLLRAPTPAPPSDLLQRLQSEIVLPKIPTPARDRVNGRVNPLRRWFPALAFSLFLLSCLIIVGVQTRLTFQLQRENGSLRALSADVEALNQNRSKSSGSLDELAQLRADHDDLLRLRAEVAALRQQAAEADRLKAENERLVAARAAPAPTESPEQRAQRESTTCEMNLRQIGLAVRVWAQDENGRNPKSAIEMTNELGSATYLFCPSDPSHEREVRNARTLGWSAFRPELISYQFILSGEKDEIFPTRIIGRCPIHGHVLVADGSVTTNALASGRYFEAILDGRLNLIRIETNNVNVNP